MQDQASSRAFTAAYSAGARALRVMLRRLGLSNELVDEVVQEAFLRAWQRRDSLAIADISRFVAVVARNLAYDMHRARAVAHRSVERLGRDLAADLQPADAAAAPLAREVTIDAVNAALGELHAEGDGMVLHLYYRDGHDINAIAAQTGLRPSSVSSRLTRERQRHGARIAGRVAVALCALEAI